MGEPKGGAVKPVPYWHWMITDEVTGKRRRTAWRMPEADAAAYPGAEKIGEPEIRQQPETEAEVIARASGRANGASQGRSE